MGLLHHLVHYLIARALYDALLRHGASPLVAFAIAGAVLFALWRRRRRRRRF